MKKAVLFVVAGLLVAVSVSAETIVNGGFDSDITFWTVNALDPDDSKSMEGLTSGTVIDEGWVTFGSSEEPRWVVENGAASRTLTTKHQQYGLGQVISNSGEGMDKGDTITFKFDYGFDGGGEGLSYRLYGITGSGAWQATAGDDRILLMGADEGDVGIGAGNYELSELVNDTIMIPGAGSVAVDVSLTKKYDYFGVVFSTDVDKGSGVTIDNVEL